MQIGKTGKLVMEVSLLMMLNYYSVGVLYCMLNSKFQKVIIITEFKRNMPPLLYSIHKKSFR